MTVLPMCRGRATAVTRPPRTARRKLVFDSMVAVPAPPPGRLRKAQKPPRLSASPMRAPPCSTPPLVQRLGSQATDAVTWSDAAVTSSTPRTAANGIDRKRRDVWSSVADMQPVLAEGLLDAGVIGNDVIEAWLKHRHCSNGRAG